MTLNVGCCVPDKPRVDGDALAMWYMSYFTARTISRQHEHAGVRPWVYMIAQSTIRPNLVFAVSD